MEKDYRKLVDEKLSEVLTQAAASEMEQRFQSEEEFSSWLKYADQNQTQKRQRRLKRWLTAAAVFVCLLLSAIGFTGGIKSAEHLNSFLPDSLESLLRVDESIASPNPDEKITGENGSIVIGGDGNGTIDMWTAAFVSYDDVPEQYKADLIWFEDMPEGYKLELIEITRNYKGTNIYYNYRCDHSDIVVEQLLKSEHDELISILNQFNETITVYGTEVHLKETAYNTRYAFMNCGNLISIVDFDKIESKKIEAMIASIRTDWSSR